MVLKRLQKLGLLINVLLDGYAIFLFSIWNFYWVFHFQSGKMYECLLHRAEKSQVFERVWIRMASAVKLICAASVCVETPLLHVWFAQPIFFAHEVSISIRNDNSNVSNVSHATFQNIKRLKSQPCHLVLMRYSHYSFTLGTWVRHSILRPSSTGKSE